MSETKDTFHNNFNYGQKFTKTQQTKHAKLLTRYGKTFKHGSIGFPVTWAFIMTNLYDELLPYKDGLTILQLKEKFGGLRLYYTYEGDESSDEQISKIITKYEGLVEELYMVKGVNA